MADTPTPVLVYDRVSANRRATRRLLALFTVLILPFVAGLIPLLTPVILFGVLLPVLGEAAFDRINSTLEGTLLMFTTTLALALLVVVAAGVAVAWLELAQATRLVLRLTRARPVTREAEPELCRTVENLSLAAGLPAPSVYVVDARTPNAFAAGLDPEHSAIVVTRGLLQLLDRRGLHGVIAHELSHIGNQDTRLSTVLAAMLAVLRTPLAMLSRTGLTRNPLAVRGCLVLSGVMAVLAALSVLGILVEIAVSLWFFSAELRDALATVTGASAPKLALMATMLFYGPFVMASPFYVLFGAQLCGRRVSGAVSRQRELLADGDAVLLTRDPEGLALSLVKVAAASGTPMDLSRAAAHLFLVEPRLPETGWWDRGVASHPPIEERVALLARMGNGVPPEALETAREAGARFRDTSPDDGSARADAPRSIVPHPPARPAADPVLAPTVPQSPEAGSGAHGPESTFHPGVVSYMRLAQGAAALLEKPEATARPRRQLPAGTVLALLAVEGEFLRVQTPDGAIGYIGKSTPVIWGSGSTVRGEA